MTNKLWNIGLFLLIPLGEAKSLFYHVDRKVDWYLLLNHKRWLCNVLEDYANAFIFVYMFLYMLYAKKTIFGTLLLRFLLILSILDLMHILLVDMQELTLLKFAFSIILWASFNKKTLLKWL